MTEWVQALEWALEEPCPLRSGPDWALPRHTIEQLWPIRLAVKHEVFEGVCILKEIDLGGHSVPYEGWLLDSDVQEPAFAQCSECPVNLACPVAGCYGVLGEQAVTQEKLRAKQLEAAVRRSFPLTEPLWYGLWLHSPLTREQRDVLFRLLDGSEQTAEFCTALRARQPLHVRLTRPGRADFGLVNYLPHCEHCRAPQAGEVQCCSVCGRPCHPREQAVMEKDDEPWPVLSQSLPDYQGWLTRLLEHRGLEPMAVERVVAQAWNRLGSLDFSGRTTQGPADY